MIALVIHPGRPLSTELRHCLAKSGLSCLMTVARLRGEPSERALAGIAAIRDHLLQVTCERRQLDPDRVFAGFEHGCHVNTDLIRNIDPWDHFSDPLEVVRDRFAIPARGRKAEYPKPALESH